MSKTPRTDDQATRSWMDLQNMTTFARQLETELADMREMFREYVKVEAAWRDERIVAKWVDLRIKADKLRKKAKEVLGL